MSRTVKVGCPMGAWGDSDEAINQMFRVEKLDYLMLEYLAEVTMGLLARSRARGAAPGYVPDFVDLMRRHLPAIRERGIRVVTNAGGINPQACARAIEKLAEEAGLSVTVAYVTGDDLMPAADKLRSCGVREWRSGEALPPDNKLLSINAYLGAMPMARTLAEGADIVIAGRTADSALCLAPLMHEFGWRETDFDRLAAGSLCGHLLECGPQATGGNFTDWERVPGWDNIGYPVAECSADGTFVLTKPQGTGGLITPETVSEQMLYEIGDPGSYLLPDVTLDLRYVSLEQAGPDRVRVSGARGRAPTSTYKATAIVSEGYRSISTIMVGGREAARKAKRVAEAILSKTRRIIHARGWPDYLETSIEVLGAESTYGPHARVGDTREVMLKIGVRHSKKDALEIFSREIAPANMGMAPGITGFYAGRPNISIVPRVFTALVEKTEVSVHAVVGEKAFAIEPPASSGTDEYAEPAIVADYQPDSAEYLVSVPLFELARARSGDKGDDALVAILARKPEHLPLLRWWLTEGRVADYFSHLDHKGVDRFDVPGVSAMIFILRNALGGGGVASLRIDPLGKALGQMLLDLPVSVPRSWVDRMTISASSEQSDSARQAQYA